TASSYDHVLARGGGFAKQALHLLVRVDRVLLMAEFDDAGEHLPGTGRVTHSTVRLPKLIRRRSVFGIELHGGFELFDGGADVSTVQQHLAQLRAGARSWARCC